MNQLMRYRKIVRIYEYCITLYCGFILICVVVIAKRSLGRWSTSDGIIVCYGKRLED